MTVLNLIVIVEPKIEMEKETAIDAINQVIWRKIVPFLTKEPNLLVLMRMAPPKAKGLALDVTKAVISPENVPTNLMITRDLREHLDFLSEAIVTMKETMTKEQVTIKEISRPDQDPALNANKLAISQGNVLQTLTTKANSPTRDRGITMEVL